MTIGQDLSKARLLGSVTNGSDTVQMGYWKTK